MYKAWQIFNTEVQYLTLHIQTHAEANVHLKGCVGCSAENSATMILGDNQQF